AGITRRPQPTRRRQKARIQQRILAELRGPDRICKHAWIGAERDPGVDQRSPTQTTANEDMHVSAKPHVVEPRGRAHAHVPAGKLQLGAQVGEPAWNLANGDLPPTLEDGDALAGPREPSSGHAAAIAGAHHDGVIAGTQVAERTGKSRHVTVATPQT